VTLVAAGSSEATLSVVMVTHGAWPLTQRALAALSACTMAVQDGSTKQGDNNLGQFIKPDLRFLTKNIHRRSDKARHDNRGDNRSDRGGATYRHQP